MSGIPRVALLALASIPALGCGPTLGVRAELAARTRELHLCYSHRVLQLTENAFEVTGCGATVEFTDVAEGGRRELVLMQPAAALARTELQCDYGALRIVGDRAPTRRSFAGCGMSASYVLGCAPDGGCRWEREGEVVVETPVSAPTVPVGLDTPIPPPPGGGLPQPIEPPAAAPSPSPAGAP